MIRRFAEETIIFVSIIKWFILASIIGVIVGCSTAIFLELLEWSSGLVGQNKYYFLLLPFAFFLSALMTKYLAPGAEGHGTEKVIEAVHKSAGKIKAAVVPVKLIATVITLASGGSAGKEGPAAQIGGGLASIFADILKFDDNDRKKLVICGISAGFATIFGAPIAGAIFGIEVLIIGTLLYDVLLPSFIAGMIGYQVAVALGVEYFYYPINFVPVFSQSFFLEVLLSGIFFGICSLLLIEILHLGEHASKKIKIWKPLQGLIGGGILIVLTLIFSTNYLGLGLGRIQYALEGGRILWYVFLLKIIFTSITLNFGGSGGIVTPIFFIGATAGAFFGRALGVDPATFAAIGMVSLLAGAANTPIAASIMAVEIFGAKVAPYAAVACVISFIMTGHRSVYPSQILAIHKTASLDVTLGKEIDEIRTSYHYRQRSITGIIMKCLNIFKGKKEEGS